MNAELIGADESAEARLGHAPLGAGAFGSFTDTERRGEERRGEPRRLRRIGDGVLL